MGGLWNLLTANVPELILLLVGVALLVVEMYIPGFGVPGLMGIGSLVLGFILLGPTLGQGLLLFVILAIILYKTRFGLRVRSCRGNQKIQWLHSRIARTLGHNIEKFSVGLCVQLVKDHAVYVEAVLGVSLRRQHLVEAVGGLKDHPLLRCEDFHPLIEGRAHPHHVCSHLENNGGLLAVGGTAVNLRPLLPIATTKQERHSRRQFALALLLGALHVGCVELAVAVFL